MAVIEALTAARIIETLENYAVAGNTTSDAADALAAGNNNYMYDDRHFWRQVFNNPDGCWNQAFTLSGFTLCHWTPRIPGLYWAPNSQSLRELAESQQVKEGKGWQEYSPNGKSGKVLGGMGGLLLPPDNAGYMLCTLTASGNSSVGVPVLIAPEVSEHHHLQQGNRLEINNARWVKMSMDWMQRFPSIKGIPRGYLLVNKPGQVQVIEKSLPVQFQPCTIMEYQHKGALLYDYVFMTTDNTVPNYRQDAADFFEYYRTKEDRKGRYLLACDMADPMFDAVYQSPAEMRTAYDNGQLELMLERIRDSHFNNRTIDELASLLPGLYPAPGSIKTLATLIELPPGFIKDDSTAKMAIELLHQCLQHKKMEELVDRVAMDHPGAFKNP